MTFNIFSIAGLTLQIIWTVACSFVAENSIIDLVTLAIPGLVAIVYISSFDNTLGESWVKSILWDMFIEPAPRHSQ